MKEVKSCGVFCLRNPEAPEFLLMKHSDRYDLPKGHIEEGENEKQCAIRELNEETGIQPADLVWIDNYRFQISYQTRYERFGNTKVNKTLIIFAAWVPEVVEVKPTEHLAAEWITWHPPHAIQKNTIDPLLADVAAKIEVFRRR